MSKPQPTQTPTPDLQERIQAYWKANTRLIVILMAIWFVAGYLHVPFAKVLNNVKILTGFPLGYWLAAQGALIVFVVLIFAYAAIMNNLDSKYGFEEEE